MPGVRGALVMVTQREHTHAEDMQGSAIGVSHDSRDICAPMHTPPPSPALVAILADGVRYERGGVVQRARECFEAVTRGQEEDPTTAAEAWWRLANLHRLHSSWDDALAAARRSAAIAREHALADVEADALNIEGAVWMMRGDYDTARELYARSLALARSPAIRGKALQNLGGLAAGARNFDEGERLFSKSREAYQIAGAARPCRC
jgi:tetratricopeptide (TPR) repeat protein